MAYSIPQITDPQIIARFDRYYIPVPFSGCWLWDGPIQSTVGYGITTINRRQIFAHRLSCAIYHGPVSAKDVVCHKCDVRLCVNPDHLWIGTHSENSLDSIAKGRHLYDKVLRGSQQTQAKLTEQVVALILVADGSSREVAKRFGVSSGVIKAIWRGRLWTHVEGPRRDRGSHRDKSLPKITPDIIEHIRSITEWGYGATVAVARKYGITERMVYYHRSRT